MNRRQAMAALKGQFPSSSPPDKEKVRQLYSLIANATALGDQIGVGCVFFMVNPQTSHIMDYHFSGNFPGGGKLFETVGLLTSPLQQLIFDSNARRERSKFYT